MLRFNPYDFKSLCVARHRPICALDIRTYVEREAHFLGEANCGLSQVLAARLRRVSKAR